MLAIAVIINNYLHDMATGVLFASGVLLFALDRRARRGLPHAREVLRAAWPALSRLALAALAWIVVGGVPRVIFFSAFEWDPAVTRGIVAALVVKHVLLVSAVAAGGVLALRVGRDVREMRDEAAA